MKIRLNVVVSYFTQQLCQSSTPYRNPEGFYLFVDMADEENPQFYWVHPSGQVVKPKDGVALMYGWRLADSRDLLVIKPTADLYVDQK